MSKINSFRDEYFFLSNFYEAPVVFRGLTYGSNEAAFQAQKNLDSKYQLAVSRANPSEAKKMGRKVELRGHWEDIKVGLMEEIVRAKFEQHPDLKEKLLETDGMYLEEGNTWGDRLWGTVEGQGANLLGQILMRVREDFLLERECAEIDK